MCRARGLGVRATTRELGRSPSTISRELRRNPATHNGKLEYRASVAQWKAELQARRPKIAKLVTNERLREYAQDRLAGVIHAPDGTPVSGPTSTWKGRSKPHRQDRRWAMSWSPEQIANRLPLDFPHDETMRISHEAIYQRSSSRVVVHSSASWSPACGPAERCVSRVLELVSGPVVTSPRR